MLNSIIFTIELEKGPCEIFVSPFLLQSKQRPDIKSGKIKKLFFYGDLRDANYKTILKNLTLSDDFRSSRYIINYGQDFGEYFLGSMQVDFDAKKYSNWEGRLTADDVEALAQYIFHKWEEARQVILFTPTSPSDFNFSRM